MTSSSASVCARIFGTTMQLGRNRGREWMVRAGAGWGVRQSSIAPFEATIVSDSANPHVWRMVTVDIKTGKASPGPIVAVIDPLDIEYDLVSLRDLIARDELYRSENGRERVDGRFVLARPFFTPAQRAAVSTHWSAQLRARIAAAKPGPQVVLDCTEDL